MKLDYQIAAGCVLIAFDAIPPDPVRTALKAQGFKFNGQAWQRKQVAGSAELVRWIRSELDKAAASSPAPSSPGPAPQVIPRPAPVAPAPVAIIPSPAPSSAPDWVTAGVAAGGVVSLPGLKSTFKAFARFKTESLAIDSAREKGCAFGFCPLDGLHYTGDALELARGPILNIQTPAPVAPIVPPPTPKPVTPQLPPPLPAAAHVKPAQPAPVAPAPALQPADTFKLRTDSPRPQPAPAPKGPKPKQLAMFRGLNDSPGQAELWGDLESYGRKPDPVAPPADPDGAPSQLSTLELAELTDRAAELARDLQTPVYLTRDLDSGLCYLRRGQAERNEHENLLRVIFPNGKFSD